VITYKTQSKRISILAGCVFASELENKRKILAILSAVCVCNEYNERHTIILIHIMTSRLLGNGGALPPATFEDDNISDPLEDWDVNKDTGILWLIVLASNILIIGLIPCLSILIQKIQERRSQNDGTEESAPQDKLNREQYLELFRSTNVALVSFAKFYSACL
jgi:hypothetical protein